MRAGTIRNLGAGPLTNSSASGDLTLMCKAVRRPDFRAGVAMNPKFATSGCGTVGEFRIRHTRLGRPLPQ